MKRFKEGKTRVMRKESGRKSGFTAAAITAFLLMLMCGLSMPAASLYADNVDLDLDDGTQDPCGLTFQNKLVFNGTRAYVYSDIYVAGCAGKEYKGNTMPYYKSEWVIKDIGTDASLEGMWNKQVPLWSGSPVTQVEWPTKIDDSFPANPGYEIVRTVYTNGVTVGGEDASAFIAMRNALYGGKDLQPGGLQWPLRKLELVGTGDYQGLPINQNHYSGFMGLGAPWRSPTELGVVVDNGDVFDLTIRLEQLHGGTYVINNGAHLSGLFICHVLGDKEKIVSTAEFKMNMAAPHGMCLTIPRSGDPKDEKYFLAPCYTGPRDERNLMLVDGGPCGKHYFSGVLTQKPNEEENGGGGPPPETDSCKITPQISITDPSGGALERGEMAKISWSTTEEDTVSSECDGVGAGFNVDKKTSGSTTLGPVFASGTYSVYCTGRSSSGGGCSKMATASFTPGGGETINYTPTITATAPTECDERYVDLTFAPPANMSIPPSYFLIQRLEDELSWDGAEIITNVADSELGNPTKGEASGATITGAFRSYRDPTVSVDTFLFSGKTYKYKAVMVFEDPISHARYYSNEQISNSVTLPDACTTEPGDYSYEIVPDSEATTFDIFESAKKTVDRHLISRCDEAKNEDCSAVSLQVSNIYKKSAENNLVDESVDFRGKFEFEIQNMFNYPSVRSTDQSRSVMTFRRNPWLPIQDLPGPGTYQVHVVGEPNDSFTDDDGAHPWHEHAYFEFKMTSKDLEASCSGEVVAKDENGVRINWMGKATGELGNGFWFIWNPGDNYQKDQDSPAFSAVYTQYKVAPTESGDYEMTMNIHQADDVSFATPLNKEPIVCKAHDTEVQTCDLSVSVFDVQPETLDVNQSPMITWKAASSYDLPIQCTGSGFDAGGKSAGSATGEALLSEDARKTYSVSCSMKLNNGTVCPASDSKSISQAVNPAGPFVSGTWECPVNVGETPYITVEYGGGEDDSSHKLKGYNIEWTNPLTGAKGWLKQAGANEPATPLFGPEVAPYNWLKEKEGASLNPLARYQFRIVAYYERLASCHNPEHAKLEGTYELPEMTSCEDLTAAVFLKAKSREGCGKFFIDLEFGVAPADKDKENLLKPYAYEISRFYLGAKGTELDPRGLVPLQDKPFEVKDLQNITYADPTVGVESPLTPCGLYYYTIKAFYKTPDNKVLQKEFFMDGYDDYNKTGVVMAPVFCAGQTNFFDYRLDVQPISVTVDMTAKASVEVDRTLLSSGLFQNSCGLGAAVSEPVELAVRRIYKMGANGEFDRTKDLSQFFSKTIDSNVLAYAGTEPPANRSMVSLLRNPGVNDVTEGTYEVWVTGKADENNSDEDHDLVEDEVRYEAVSFLLVLTKGGEIGPVSCSGSVQDYGETPAANVDWTAQASGGLGGVMYFRWSRGGGLPIAVNTVEGSSPYGQNLSETLPLNLAGQYSVQVEVFQQFKDQQTGQMVEIGNKVVGCTAQRDIPKEFKYKLVASPIGLNVDRKNIGSIQFTVNRLLENSRFGLCPAGTPWNQCLSSQNRNVEIKVVSVTKDNANRMGSFTITQSNPKAYPEKPGTDIPGNVSQDIITLGLGEEACSLEDGTYEIVVCGAPHDDYANEAGDKTYFGEDIPEFLKPYKEGAQASCESVTIPLTLGTSTPKPTVMCSGATDPLNPGPEHGAVDILWTAEKTVPGPYSAMIYWDNDPNDNFTDSLTKRDTGIARSAWGDDTYTQTVHLREACSGRESSDTCTAVVPKLSSSCPWDNNTLSRQTYSYTAGSNGCVNVSTGQNSFDAGLAVYALSTSENKMKLVGCNDNCGEVKVNGVVTPNTLKSAALRFPTRAGTQYEVVVIAKDGAQNPSFSAPSFTVSAPDEDCGS